MFRLVRATRSARDCARHCASRISPPTESLLSCAHGWQNRDRDFWKLLLPVLHDTWFNYIEPAKRALNENVPADDVWKRFTPPKKHGDSDKLKKWAIALAVVRRVTCDPSSCSVHCAVMANRWSDLCARHEHDVAM